MMIIINTIYQPASQQVSAIKESWKAGKLESLESWKARKLESQKAKKLESTIFCASRRTKIFFYKRILYMHMHIYVLKIKVLLEG